MWKVNLNTTDNEAELIFKGNQRYIYDLSKPGTHVSPNGKVDLSMNIHKIFNGTFHQMNTKIAQR